MQETIFHPIRVRIIQLLAGQEPLTVAGLAEKMSDIPRSTIYRHVSALYEMQVLRVASEQKIRGACEKAYTLSAGHTSAPQGQEENVVTALLAELLSDFSRYFRAPNAAPQQDQLFFSINALMLSDRELEAMKGELFGVMQKYLNFPPEKGRKTRKISIISSPGGDGGAPEARGEGENE